jgi:hypothetical protein
LSCLFGQGGILQFPPTDFLVSGTSRIFSVPH